MNKTVFGIMCIAFNALGVPCFMQKQIKTGILRIVLGIVTCGVIEIINIVKGIVVSLITLLLYKRVERLLK